MADKDGGPSMELARADCHRKLLLMLEHGAVVTREHTHHGGRRFG